MQDTAQPSSSASSSAASSSGSSASSAAATRSSPLQVHDGHASLRRPLERSVVAIGNFDGVHRGHQHLFAEIRERAAARGGESVVLTFEPHPARVLSPRYAPPLITPLERKLELIEEAGVDACVVEPFDAELAALSPEAFVERILVRALGAVEVCVGYDFTFGHKRAGDVHLLGALGRRHGFQVSVAEPVTADGMVCSSTKVREFVLEGRVEGAALLLGRDFDLDGEVVRGDGRGATIGIPTANLSVPGELQPRGGVYAGWARVREGNSSSRFGAAINIGKNPTFASAGGGVRIEAHLLDFPPRELYGERIRLGFTARLRDERRFDSVDELVAQIRSDVEAARRVFRTGSPSGS